MNRALICMMLATGIIHCTTAATHTTRTTAPRLPFMRGMNFCGYYGDYLEYSTATDTPTSAQRYADLKAKGFDHIRLPIDFRKYSDFNSATGVATLKEDTNTSTWWGGTTSGPGFATFDQILDLAEDAGLYVVIDFHGWFDINTTNDLQRAQFKACWAAVAERYKDRSNKVIFELANEPRVNNGTTIKALNSLQKETVAIIRETNPTRLILYAVADANQPWALTIGQNPSNFGWVSVPENDNNIALVIHCYNPGTFTHQGCTWADPSYTNQVRLTNSHRSTLNWDFTQVKLYMDNHDVPIVMNEFNVAHQIADHGDVTEYLSMVTRFCESNNIPWAPWLYLGSGSDEMNVRIRGGGWHDYIMDGLFPDLKTTDAFDPADYSNTLDIAFTGYAGGTTLTNFPALVKLTENIPGFSYGDFRRQNGGDLRFIDENGNLIPHEIDTWNTNGVSTVWVKVPSLTANAKVTALYGCDKPCVPKVESVWDGDYVGVWHLGESELPLKESSETSRDFTAADGAGIGYGAEGVVGGSVNFGETGNGRGIFTDDHAALDGFSQCTIEVWTYQDVHATNVGILSKRIGYGNQVSYFMHDNGSETVSSFSANGTDSASGVRLSPPLGKWNHQVVSVDATSSSSNSRGFMNGVLHNTDSISLDAIFAGPGELCLGNFQTGDARNFPGKIDEVRISKCIRSADWIQATHDTVAKTDFATYAVEVVEPEPTVAVVSDEAGFDWTNRTISVSGVTAGATLTLAVEASDGSVRTETVVADGSGRAAFDLATTPGAAYTYRVEQSGETLAGGAFLAGGWEEPGSLFSAAPDGRGGSAESGGAWAQPPQATNASSYAVGGSARFALSEGARAEGGGKLVRVDAQVEYSQFLAEGANVPQGPADPVARFAAVATGGSGAAWKVLLGGEWKALRGADAPRLGVPYVVRMETDLSASPVRVRCSVSADGGATFATLSDASGATWLEARGSPRGTLSGVSADGCGALGAVKGSAANACVASAGGVGYASLAEAAAAGGDVTLLTNATLPTDAPTGTFTVQRGGYSLLLPPDGVSAEGDSVVVSAGVCAMEGVGTIRVGFAGLARAGVETAGRTPAQIAAALKETGANGLPRWQSYVLGLDASDPRSLPRAEIGGAAGGLALSLGGVDVDETAGADVSFRVFEAMDLSDPSSDVPLGGLLPTGASLAIETNGAETRFFRIRIYLSAH